MSKEHSESVALMQLQFLTVSWYLYRLLRTPFLRSVQFTTGHLFCSSRTFRCAQNIKQLLLVVPQKDNLVVDYTTLNNTPAILNLLTFIPAPVL